MFNGKVALITGANRGIGKSILELFIKNNAKVICVVRKIDKKFHKYLKKNKNVDVIVSDINDEINLKTKIQNFFSKKNKLDILVNNAGEASGSIIEMTSQKNLKEIFDTNFFSQIRLTQLTLRYLKNSKSPSIINIGSIVNFIPERGTLAYGSSKAAFMHATKIMANEFSDYKIRVNGICPNVTKTRMLKKMDVKSRENLILKSYSKKACEPNEIAKTVLFLASENSYLINGQIIRLDGGSNID